MAAPVPASIKITNFVSVRKRLHELNAHLFKVVLWATEFIKIKKLFLQSSAIRESCFHTFLKVFADQALAFQRFNWDTPNMSYVMGRKCSINLFCQQ